MTKELFQKILSKLDIRYNEGITSDDNIETPRLVFWNYVWEDIDASGEGYNTIVTYQVSMFSDEEPMSNQKLKDLKKELAKYDLRPTIFHEYVEKTREWHSYFSIDILENV